MATSYKPFNKQQTLQVTTYSWRHMLASGLGLLLSVKLYLQQLSKDKLPSGICMRIIQRWCELPGTCLLSSEGALPTHEQLVLAMLVTRDTRADWFPAPSRISQLPWLEFHKPTEEFHSPELFWEVFMPKHYTHRQEIIYEQAWIRNYDKTKINQNSTLRRHLKYLKYLHLCETVVTMIRMGTKKNKIVLITDIF